ncbi:DNA-3-methyladenine glycosylase [Agrobacterium sp.]|uniref:DNA-3-methyladenine glycosylase n=1 Tax=Agrobacterium sp. TaxID=361 RepID=UPI00289E437D|nr:DNA-3-methyladenine glycosylase [Agrobacterium sp.]
MNQAFSPEMQANFFKREALDVARALIGAEFRVGNAGGIIVETEAYHPDDPASHAFNGQTPRNRAMFGPAGHLYVYRSYGIHWCANFVCAPGSAVLLRAIEPLIGLDMMKLRRGTDKPKLLCSGPGRLCQAMAITGDMDGMPLDAPPFFLRLPKEAAAVSSGRRIGISRAVDYPWRFGLAGSVFISKKFENSENKAI